MDKERFKDCKQRLDSLLELQSLPAESLVRLILTEATPAQNGPEPQPGPSSAITANNNTNNQILNDESLALSLLHEEEVATPEEMLRELMHLAEMWVGEIFRHSIGNYYDKSTLDTKLDGVYEKIIEYAQVKYLAKCNEDFLELYDTWWKKVYYTTIVSMNVNKKNTKAMIEDMFGKRFGGLEKRLCQEWCITYTSTEDVMNQLMEDDTAEMGLLKFLGSEWVNLYNDLKLIKATDVYETISFLKNYEEELISLVKNEQNGFQGKEYYVNKCTSKLRSFKVPPGLCKGTKQKVTELANHLSSRLDDIVKTEKATVTAVMEYSLKQYEIAMKQKLVEAKDLSEIDILHENLKRFISKVFADTGKAGFSFAWNFEKMPLSKTLEIKYKTYRDALQLRIAQAKPQSIQEIQNHPNPNETLQNGGDDDLAFDDSATDVLSPEPVDDDKKDVKPEIKQEQGQWSQVGVGVGPRAGLGNHQDHVVVKTEPKVKTEPESPPPLVKDPHPHEGSHHSGSSAEPSTRLKSESSTESVQVTPNGSGFQTDLAVSSAPTEEQKESATTSVASQLSRQPVVQMSNLNPSPLKPNNQQSPVQFIKKIKHRGIGMFISQSKILYLVEGYKPKELSPTFEIPSQEGGIEAATFDVYQLLTAQSDKIEKQFNIGGQDIQPYNEVPMAYHLASIREMMVEQQEPDQKFTDSVIAVAIPASVTSFSRNRLKVAMELAGMNRTILVQITTSVAVGYSQKPQIPTDVHPIVVVYVCDGLIEMAVFRIAQNKCIQLASGINTTIPEVTLPYIESFGITFKALWNDILSRANIEETSIYCTYAILEKPTASPETGNKYCEAIRKEVSENSKLFFTRDSRSILVGLKSVSSYGSSLPNGLIEEVYPWKFVIKHPVPEKTVVLSDFCAKAESQSSNERVKVCDKPVKVHRLWHGGGANEELQFALKPIPTCKPTTLRLLTEISLHPEGILAAACVQKAEGICDPVFVLNHMPLEKDVEAICQLQELRNMSSQPPSKKSKMES